MVGFMGRSGVRSGIRLGKALLALALAGVLAGGPAFAAGDDVFVVPRVPVQAQADSATAAKQAAQDMGRRRAMDILLRRVTVEEDWVYLPRLAAGQPAGAGAGNAEAFDPNAAYTPPSQASGPKRAIALSGRDLELLESGFEVYAEKSSATTYRAYITYRFKPDSVRRLLKDARLPYSETQTRTALVIPVLQTANGLYLWEENNPWMAAWKSRPYNNELTPMSAPLGDLEDAARLNARQALALDAGALAAMAEHYGVSQVVVAHARLQQTGGQDRLTVRLINGYRESSHVPLDVELDPALADIESAEYDVKLEAAEEISAKVGDVLAQVTDGEATGNFPVLAERAIETAIAKYASGWKAKTLIDHAAESILETSAFFESVSDWTKIRTGLSATPLVGSVQVFALSPRGAEMRLKVFGDPSRLAVAMENYGVVFWSEDGRHWLLATPGQARALRGSRWLRQRRSGLFGESDVSSDGPRIEPASQTEEERGDGRKIEQRR